MRIRVLLLSFFILPFMLVCGCGKQEPPVPLGEFTAQAAVRVSDSLQNRFELQAQVVSAAYGVLSIGVTSPRELSGLCYSFGKEFQMSYMGLQVKCGQAEYLPDFSFARVIYEVLKDLPENGVCVCFEDGVAVFEGSCTAGEYVACTDERGYVQNISVKEIDLSVEFSYTE